jgi:hypothetical protein
MLTPVDAQFLTEATASLASHLYASLDKGRLLAHEHYDQHEMNTNAYTKGRTDLTRDHARRHLELAKEELGPWKLSKASSGRLHLVNNLLVVRVLHGLPFAETPAPGRNKARVSYYLNPPANLFGVESSRLLAVWSVDEKSGETVIRIVRPTGTWKHGHTAQTDIDFVLPRLAEDFTKFEFIPDDKDFTLPFEFDNEDLREEGDTGA